MVGALRISVVLCALGGSLFPYAAHGDQFTWTGGAGSTVWADPANWVNVTPGGTATFPDADDNAAFYANHQVTNGAAANLTNSGTTWIGPGSVTVNDGVILNHGLLTYVGAAGPDDENLVINDSVLLTGAGTLRLTPSGNSFVLGNKNTQIDPFNLRDVLTNDVNHTIRGAGEISVDVANRGTMSADVSGQQLRLQGSLLDPRYAGSQNSGTINVTNFSQFGVSGVRLDNRDGTINVASASTLNITAGEISGGRVVGGSGSGALLTGTTGSLRDVTLSGQWTSIAPTLAGTITFDGTVIVGPTSGSANLQMRIADIVTFRGAGELLLNASINAASTGVNPPELLINEQGHTIRTSSRSVTASINVDFINRGKIISQSRFQPRALPAGAIGLSVGSFASLGGNSTNAGEIQVVRDAHLNINGRLLNNSQGKISLDDGAWLFLGNTVLHGGQLVAGSGTGANFSPSSSSSFVGDISFAGNWTFSSGPTYFGRIDNHGRISSSGMAISRSVTFAGDGELIFRGSTIPNVASGGESTTLDPARVLNTAGHTIRGSANFTVPVVNEARLLPGTMTISNLSLGSTSKLIIAPFNLTQFGSIKATAESSVMHLDGELIVDFQGNYVPGPRTFDILSAAAISGDFASFTVSAPSLPWIGPVSYEIIPNATGTLDVVRLTINNGVSGLAGDFNNDGFVDARDYTLWRDQKGTATFVANDPTPETFDEADHAVWAANFGRSWLGAVATPVPEARAALLALLALCAVRVTLRQHR